MNGGERLEAMDNTLQQETLEDASIWPRDGFTFFRSYYDAIKKLPKKDRADTILTVCEYALYGNEPEKITAVAEAMFTLIRPVIDSGIKKAESGAKGGKAKGKQDGSKTKAKKKQPSRDKESEEEEDKDNEFDKEYDVDVDAETEATLKSEVEKTRLRLMNGELGRGVVALTDEQICDLLKKLDLEMFDYYVEKLAEWIIRNNAKVKSHYKTILKWWREDSRVEP